MGSVRVNGEEDVVHACAINRECTKFVGCRHRRTILEEVKAVDRSEDSVPRG